MIQLLLLTSFYRKNTLPKARDGVQIQKTNCELLIIVFQNIKALYLGDLTRCLRLRMTQIILFSILQSAKMAENVTVNCGEAFH